MKCKEVELCSFANWYSLFEDITFKSIIIPLPKDVFAYFEDGGTIVLPEDCQTENNNDADDGEPYIPSPNLGDFSEILTCAIKTLGGEVLPKLNWSSPKDVLWMSYSRSLKCLSPSDIYPLMKSSQFVAHDLTSPFEHCDDMSTYKSTIEYSLILREWKEINEPEEFRCYVKNSTLIGICQREASQYYSSIAEQKEDIVTDIMSFYETLIKNIFPSCSYTFDVHRPQKNKIYLVDFNPFGVTTDSILFTWEELINDNVSEKFKSSYRPELRCVDVNFGIQPDLYEQYNYPFDFHIASVGDSTSHNQLEYLLRMLQTQDDDVGSSSDSE